MRLLLPSWKFFSENSSITRLYFRTQTPEDQWSDWQIFMPPTTPRKWFHLFFNADYNMHLYRCSLVDRVACDPTIESINWLKEIVVEKIHEPKFQFKITEQQIYQYEKAIEEDIVISEIYVVNS